ncbi:MAG: alpha/beta hydrolase [Akkermansiaceae bacterium]|nr:alpha/beta hydrolase [Akkermansiaceae bacterium]
MMCVLLLAGVAAGEEWLNLYEGPAPGAARPPAGSEVVTERGHITNVEVPQYLLYMPASPNGTGVVVCPGGGYGILAMGHEGREVGEWFAKRGVTAMILKYRVAREAGYGYRFPVPQLDARRAIRTMRAKGKDWGVKPDRIGVMGFSAGGHLASTCATLFGESFDGESSDLIDTASARPDFAILCYPVIAMGERYCHGGSVKNLLGEDPPAELLAKCNSAKQVRGESPPCFIVHSADDGAVPLRNGAEFAARCAESKVPVVCHFYAEGGHGYGLKGRGDSEGWTTRLEEWMQGNGWMAKGGL